MISSSLVSVNAVQTHNMTWSTQFYPPQKTGKILF